MHALRGEAELHGATVALETHALSGRMNGSGLVLETGGASPAQDKHGALPRAARSIGGQEKSRVYEDARELAGGPGDQARFPSRAGRLIGPTGLNIIALLHGVSHVDGSIKIL